MAVGQRPAARMRAGSGSTTSAQRLAVLAHEREDLRRREPLRRRVSARPRRRAPVSSPVGAWDWTRKRLRASYLPCSTSRVPGAVLALEPRLVEERRLHDPGLVGDGGLDERLHPAAAHGPRRDRADLDDDGRVLVRRQLRDRTRLASGRAGGARAGRRPSAARAARRPSRRARARPRAAAASRDGRGRRGPPSPHSSSSERVSEEANATGGDGTRSMMAGYSAAISHQ